MKFRIGAAALMALVPRLAWAQAQFQTYQTNGAAGGTPVAGTVLECAAQYVSGNTTTRVAAPCGTADAPVVAARADGGAMAYSATATGPFGAAVDTLGYASVSYSFTSLPTGASVLFQESPDGVNWSAATLFSDGGGAVVIAATATMPGTYRVPAGARYQRMMIATYTSGTVGVQVRPRGAAVPAPGLLTEATLQTSQAGAGLKTRLPTATAAAASASNTGGTANSAVAVFAAGSIADGCYVQNPPANTATITVDWGGGTPASPIAPQDAAPGTTLLCPFVPSGAVTMWSATASVAVKAGRF